MRLKVGTTVYIHWQMVSPGKNLTNLQFLIFDFQLPYFLFLYLVTPYLAHCAAHDSFTYFLKYPIKSIKSANFKDFRFQDYKDF